MKTGSLTEDLTDVEESGISKGSTTEAENALKGSEAETKESDTSDEQTLQSEPKQVFFHRLKFIKGSILKHSAVQTVCAAAILWLYLISSQKMDKICLDSTF